MSTSTHTWRGSTPSIANVASRASTPVTLRADLRGVGDGVFQLCSNRRGGIAQSPNTAMHTCDELRRSVGPAREDRRKRPGEAREKPAAGHLVRPVLPIL